MNTNQLWVRVVCVVFVCVCVVYLPSPSFLQMTSVHMFNDDTSVFLLFGYLLHHTALPDFRPRATFSKVAESRVFFDLVQSMRGRLVASVLGCVRLASSFSTSAFSASKFNSLASRYGTVVWGKKSTNQ
jgi:hypothetical protein